MIRPDAIPVRPLGSQAVLPPEAVPALFGEGAKLRAGARVDVVLLGKPLVSVPVEAGAALALRLDAIDAEAVERADGLWLRGPVGALPAPPPASVAPRLVLPDGLRRAWGVPDVATLGLSRVAITASVTPGTEAAAVVDRALWLAAGRPETARWLPGLDLAVPDALPDRDERVVTVARRVVTETDVRQARLHHKRIRLGDGQIVTPAAQTLGREWNVFESTEAGEPD